MFQIDQFKNLDILALGSIFRAECTVHFRYASSETFCILGRYSKSFSMPFSEKHACLLTVNIMQKMPVSL